MATQSGVTTANELLILSQEGQRYELVDGVLRQMTPAGHLHGRVAARIGASLTTFVEPRRLGATYAAETGFLLRCEPDTVRAPDASFVSGVRVEAAGTSAGYFPGAPDLAVEVASPGDAHSAVDEKVTDWIGSGCRAVVVLDPNRRTATIHRPGAPVETLTAGDHLALPDLLPGWSVPLAELYR